MSEDHLQQPVLKCDLKEQAAATANAANLQVCPVQAPGDVWACPFEIHQWENCFRTGWALGSKCSIYHALLNNTRWTSYIAFARTADTE